MRVEDIENLHELLGGWEKVVEVLLTNRIHYQRYIDTLNTLGGNYWSADLLPLVLLLVMSPAVGEPYRRRMQQLYDRQAEYRRLDHEKMFKQFNAVPPWSKEDSEALDNDRRFCIDNMSKRTRRRLSRR